MSFITFILMSLNLIILFCFGLIIFCVGTEVGRNKAKKEAGSGCIDCLLENLPQEKEYKDFCTLYDDAFAEGYNACLYDIKQMHGGKSNE